MFSMTMKNDNESTDLLWVYDVASSMTVANINGHKLWNKKKQRAAELILKLHNCKTDKAMTYPAKGQYCSWRKL